MSISSILFKKASYIWLVGIVSFIGIVSIIIHKGRQEQHLYIVSAVVNTIEGLNKDLSYLHQHFKGDLTRLPTSIETVILKPGNTLLDMLWMGETTVQPKWSREYRNLNLALANDYVHIHQTPEQIHYVLAGQRVKGLDFRNDSIVLYLMNVERQVVSLLEEELGRQLSHFPSTLPGTRDVSIVVYLAQSD